MSRRTGLTLIELSVALAISALLAAAALRAATTLARVEAIERGSAEATDSDGPVRRLLRTDLVHAKRYRTTKNGLELESWAMLDEQTLAIEHLPGTVTYPVQAIDDTPWLIRRQRRSSAGDAEDFDELVCPGVKRVALETSGSPAGRTGPGGWRTVPAAATMVIEFSDSAGAESRPELRLVVHSK